MSSLGSIEAARETPTSLEAHLAAVHRRVVEAIDGASVPEPQRALLRATVAPVLRQAAAEPFGSPLVLEHLVATAHGRRTTEPAAVHTGAFLLLYILALDLFDDVQDGETSQTAHAEAGDAVAINSALALLFLALDELRRAMEIEPPAHRLGYLALFNRISLLAVGGQHEDLVSAPRGKQEVLACLAGKTSSMSLVAECGALLGRCDDAQRQRYRELGEHMAILVQIRDDLADVYGKDHSPDLRDGKVTYPLACFLERATADERARLEALMSAPNDELRAIRELLHTSGAVDDAASSIEASRQRIHQAAVEAGGAAGPMRALLSVVDALASGVYEPAEVEVSRVLREPTGGWHDEVREELRRFQERTRGLGLAAPPRLCPWHLPQWMFVTEPEAIWYPDLEDLAVEILPFQAHLLGEPDPMAIEPRVRAQLPAVLAHELFHFQRLAHGRLTLDHWHEEWAANRLAVAYLSAHAPDVLAESLALADDVLARFPHHLDEQAKRVLARCSAPTDANGYGMDAEKTAVVSLALVRQLAAEAPPWPDVCGELLGAPRS